MLCKMLALLSVLLLSSHVLTLVQSTSCDDKTEYLNDNTCCKKCKPGELLIQKCTQQMADTECARCGDGYFTDDYNINYHWCNECRTCTKDHMMYEKNCTSTSDAVCTCVEGYRCRDSKCQECEKIQTSTVSSLATIKAIPPTHDIVWISTCTTIWMDHANITWSMAHRQEQLWIQPVHRGRGGTNASAGDVWKD
ncbi:CD27 antigen-like isoform X3 [Cyprinus carpio]|uniref:CD27 antigen-like isoform X3 n=2 Tax=Cyprinus carpio TaxID=7962 RepID=A0A9Q9X7K1_CYPCA|nr:CD27 antigen-like isoform X3 [Cyprinus carpio]